MRTRQLLVPGIGLVALGAVAAARPPADALGPTVAVDGWGQVSAKPDLAEVSVGVVTQASAAKTALATNSSTSRALLARVRKQGVAERNVQTSFFDVAPVYQRDSKGGVPPKIVAYRVTERFRITVRDLDGLGPLLDAAVAEGAAEVQGIAFGIANPRALADEARRDAMADARRRAALYAKAAGLTLGSVRRIEELSAEVPRPAVRAAFAERAGSVPIAPGELTAEARVRVVFALTGGSP